MWIHQFVILQLFHPNFCMAEDILLKHKNSGLFVRQFTRKETQEYVNLFHDTPRYQWLWLGKNYWNVYRLLIQLFDKFLMGVIIFLV
jgi:hypothetical protein